MRELTCSKRTSIVLHNEDYLNAGLTQDEMIEAIEKRTDRNRIWMVEKYPINNNIQVHILGHNNDLIMDIVKEIEEIFEEILKKKNMIPEINKYYNFFDDGKIHHSRKDTVIINKVIPFNEIDDDTKNFWMEEKNRCDWLYNNNTDYFLKGYLLNSEQNVIFVRTIDNGWFSLGWWGGLLDVYGAYTELLEN